MNQTRTGLAYGVGAYLLWGAFPFYFGLISEVNPLEVAPWRVFSTLAFCVIVVSLTGRWGGVVTILRTPRLLGWFALASLLLYCNWQIFVIGVMTGHVLEASLGYFINPLFTVFIGVVFRGERLSRLQWIAIAIAAVGVCVAAIAYGQVPWIALGLAFTFGLYGAVHKKVGESVDGLTGLTIETMSILPVAVIQFVVVAQLTGIGALNHGGLIFALVLFSGVMTAVPLILFGESARRLKLSYLGFVQFVTPILGFLYGYFVAHEHMAAPRWIGFVAVWIALVILIIDMLRTLRRGPGLGPATGPISIS